MEPASSIDLQLAEKLRDPEYRRKFFLAEVSAQIAAQIIALRKRRGLSQSQVAEKIQTGQSAISRVERADYRNWSFNTLRKIADALDARIRMTIEPSEDVLFEYERGGGDEVGVSAARAFYDGASSSVQRDPMQQFSFRSSQEADQLTGARPPIGRMWPI